MGPLAAPPGSPADLLRRLLFGICPARVVCQASAAPSAAVFCQGHRLDPDPPRPGRLPSPARPLPRQAAWLCNFGSLSSRPARCAPCFCQCPARVVCQSQASPARRSSVVYEDRPPASPPSYTGQPRTTRLLQALGQPRQGRPPGSARGGPDASLTGHCLLPQHRPPRLSLPKSLYGPAPPGSSARLR